jgi:LmbE family N-acetylglucosaminyl deacetylase
MTGSPVLYLSPHLDDAVLSCGGMIRRRVAGGGRAVVITVFAGSPRVMPSSPLIEALHARWGLGTDPPAARRREDLAALGRLGAEPIHLAHTDCVYRLDPAGDPIYAEDAAIFGDVSVADPVGAAQLAVEIRRLWEALGRGVIVAPLSAGHHVDHQLVRRAADALLGVGAEVTFYEDYPYAADSRAVDCALGDPGGWRSETVPLSRADLYAWVGAIACYRSQISTFWTDTAGMRRHVRAYADVIGGGSPGWRRWRPVVDGETSWQGEDAQ